MLMETDERRTCPAHEGGSDMFMNMEAEILLLEGEVPLAVNAVGVEGKAGGRGDGVGP